MHFLASIIQWFYVALPAVMLAVVVRRCLKRGDWRPAASTAASAILGLLLGSAVCVGYAVALHGYAPAWQFLVAGYFATSLLLVLKLLNSALDAVTRALFGAKRRSAALNWRWRLGAAFLLRAGLLYATSIPLIIAVLLIYRPRIVDPEMAGFYEARRAAAISFASNDGTRRTGLWMASAVAPGGAHASSWGARAAIVCRGPEAGNEDWKACIDEMVTNGFNVLAIDLGSQPGIRGQLTGFGDVERQDVLGAVRWMRANRPAESESIVGLGIGSGAAAIIAAATEPGDEGEAIAAVAVIDTFDELPRQLEDLARQYLPGPIGWVATTLSVPLANAHVGASLARFAPIALIDRIAPRPVFVVHHSASRLVDVARGGSLFEGASQPKLSYYAGDASHPEQTDEPAIAIAIRVFFEQARLII